MKNRNQIFQTRGPLYFVAIQTLQKSEPQTNYNEKQTIELMYFLLVPILWTNIKYRHCAFRFLYVIWSLIISLSFNPSTWIATKNKLANFIVDEDENISKIYGMKYKKENLLTWAGTCEDLCPCRACSKGSKRRPSQKRDRKWGRDCACLAGRVSCVWFCKWANRPIARWRSRRKRPCGRCTRVVYEHHKSKWKRVE